MKKIFSVALMVLTGVISCSQETELNTGTSTNTVTGNKFTVEEVKSNVIDFINNINRSDTRAFNKDVSILNVKAISVGNMTRAVGNTNADTLFYIVNFSDSCGFAIASADRQDTPILALVENGNYNEEDTLNNGFNAFLDAICQNHGMIQQATIKKQPSIEEVHSKDEGSNYFLPDKFEVMRPLLKTRWDQQSPYNKYCPGHYTGCVITAVSQICSFLECPRNISYRYNSEFGAASMDWKKINQECSLSDGTPQSEDTEEQVARLIRFWGLTFEAKYSDGGTSADTNKALDKMRTPYGFNVTGLSDYNVDNVIKDLKCGNKIILMRGNGRYYHVFFFFRKYVDGHAWVVDGYIDQIKNNKENKYIHCNWGWGPRDQNGYFLSDVLNAEQNPVYNDDVTPTRGGNYRYKLQTATFTK